MHNDWNIAVIHIHKNIYRDDQNKNNNILGWSGNEHIVILTMPNMNMNIVTIVVTRIISLGLVGVCMVVSTYEIWRGPPTVLSHPSPMKGQLEPSSRWDKHQDKWVSELDGMECQPWLTSTGWTNTHTQIYTQRERERYIYIHIYIYTGESPKKVIREHQPTSFHHQGESRIRWHSPASRIRNFRIVEQLTMMITKATAVRNCLAEKNRREITTVLRQGWKMQHTVLECSYAGFGDPGFIPHISCVYIVIYVGSDDGRKQPPTWSSIQWYGNEATKTWLKMGEWIVEPRGHSFDGL